MRPDEFTWVIAAGESAGASSDGQQWPDRDEIAHAEPNMLSGIGTDAWIVANSA